MAAPPVTPVPARDRPLSPHMQVWRWHITMVASILTRASGIALYVGALGLAIWLWALATGPQTFQPLDAFLKGPLGQLMLFGMAVASAYHFAAGVRHLIWDSGRGLNPKTADVTAWIAIVFALVAPLALWAVAGL